MSEAAVFNEILRHVQSDRDSRDWLFVGEELELTSLRDDESSDWIVRASFYPRMIERKEHPIRRGGVWVTEWKEIPPPLGRDSEVHAEERVAAVELKRAVQLRAPQTIAAAAEAAVDRLRYHIATASVDVTPFIGISPPVSDDDDDALSVFADALGERGWEPSSGGRGRGDALRVLLGEARAIADRLSLKESTDR